MKNNQTEIIKKQRKQIKELQKELKENEDGIKQINIAVDGILSALVARFGENSKDGKRTLILPAVKTGKSGVTAQRVEKGYLLSLPLEEEECEKADI